MLVHIEYPTQEKEVQDQLEAAVAAAKPADADPNGLLRIVVRGLVFIGKLFIASRHRRFVVERCEKAESASKQSEAVSKQAQAVSKQAQAVPAKAATPAPAKKATKRSASKQAKPSKAKRSK